MGNSALAKTLIKRNGVIILPRNDIYKTPEIIFRSPDIEAAMKAVEKFLIPIEQSTSTEIFRIAMKNHYNATFSASIELNFLTDGNRDMGGAGRQGGTWHVQGFKTTIKDYLYGGGKANDVNLELR